MVTYSDLFTFVIMICAIITLVRDDEEAENSRPALDMIPSVGHKNIKTYLGIFYVQKSKIDDAVKKVEIVEQYLNGELSQKGAAKMCGVNKRSVQDWIRIYKKQTDQKVYCLLRQINATQKN